MLNPNEITKIDVNGQSIEYLIKAIVIYKGNGSNGHYFLYARNTFSQKWDRINDSNITTVEKVECVGASMIVLEQVSYLFFKPCSKFDFFFFWF